MTALKIPTRPQDRHSMLVQASFRINGLLQREASGLNPLLLAEISAVSLSLDAALKEVAARKGEQANLRVARAARRDALAQLIRDFVVVTKRRSNREPRGGELGRLFQVQLRELNRQASLPLNLIRMARELLEAEAQALALGFAPSVNPSSADLEAAIAGSETLFAEFDRVTYELKEAQVRLLEANESSGPVLRQLGSNLRTIYRKKPKSICRELMRTFGFRYGSSGGSEEVVDTDEGSGSDPVAGSVGSEGSSAPVAPVTEAGVDAGVDAGQAKVNLVLF